MTLVVPTTASDEETCKRDRTSSSAYSPMQDNELAYTAAFARMPTRQDEGATGQGIRMVIK
jgi:hypothetical protein